MSKIKIKNFGPIKEGYQEDDGFMDVKKVTVFIGNQGSGKSTVAKVISTMTWLEKAFNRGDIPEPKFLTDFKKYFEYQGLKGYFKESTIIEYYGDLYNIVYNKDDSLNVIIHKSDSGNYTVPKIMYVPSERNFLSVIKNATGVRGLPPPLFEFAEELKRGQNESEGKEIPLPINGVNYKYDKKSDSSFIIGNDFNINLLVASSGFQSLVPLYLVSLSLAEIIKNGAQLNPDNISVDQSIRMSNEIGKVLMNIDFTEEEKIRKVDAIQAKFQNRCFINIVEEPEQNLYPTSQQQILNSLLAFNNLNRSNKLLMTTHSPYLINYLTLAVKASSLIDRSMNYKGKSDFKTVLSKIVPIESAVKADDLIIYEFDEKNGSIKLLETYKGLPSDENELNEELAESNEKFAQLLEIEQQL
jgi:predicted ATPase